MTYKKKALILSIIVLVITIIGSCYYYFSRIKPYNDFLNTANQAMAEDEYDKALILYEEALNYKKSPDIINKIELAKLLKNSKGVYDTAIEQMDDKKYLDAIESFKKVNNKDSKRCSTIESKIDECKKLYIAENLKSANESFKNNKLDDASQYLENIFKLDENNQDAITLKNDVDNAIQKQKNDAIALAKAQEEKKKAEQETAKILTVDQATNILKSYVYNDIISYTPNNNYVSEGAFSNHSQIRNDYYIFSISSQNGDMYDYNLCVNKKSGEVYRADPTGGFTKIK